jgi:hypothetical protein
MIVTLLINTQPVFFLPSWSFKIHFNNALNFKPVSSKVLFPSRFYIKDFLNYSSVPRFPHAQRVYDIWSGVRVMKLLIMHINIVGINMEINISSYY